MLGTAPDDVIAGLAAAVLAKDTRSALAKLDTGLGRALQPGELLDQLIEYWRDLMLVATGGNEVVGLSASPRLRETITSQAAATPLDTILAGLDILQTTLSRLRGSSHGRVLLEMALIRLSRIDDLVSLSQLAQVLQGDRVATPSPPPRPSTPSLLAARPVEPEPAKKKPPELNAEPANRPITPETLRDVWSEVLAQVGPLLGGQLKLAGPPAIIGPNRLVLHFPPTYNHECEFCSDPGRLNRVLDVLERLTGETWDLRLELEAGRNGDGRNGTAEPAALPRPPAQQQPLVQAVIDLLEARVLRVDDGFGQTAPAPDDSEVAAADGEES
jgi:DNA polymerase-3 subunit gamma/tau